MNGPDKHEDTPKPYIVGKWMVTGPNSPHGTGFSLCIHKGGKCQRCVAEFTRKRDAFRAARLFHVDQS